MHPIFAALKNNAILKYLRELSVVVIGVAITLSASDWLNSRQERQDTTKYLDMVKFELETNLRALNSWKQTMAQEANYAHYVLRRGKHALQPDTLRHYQQYYIGEHSCYVSFAAFEMFKASGCMRLIKEKRLLWAIWKTYGILDMWQTIVNEYNTTKKSEMTKETMQIHKSGSPAAMSLYDFYTSGMVNADEMLAHCNEIAEALQASIAQIAQQGQ